MQSRFVEVQALLQAEPKSWLVTGAAGFIGSHLVEKLLKLNQTVVGLDNFATGHQHNLDEVLSTVGAARDRFRFVSGSITDSDACTQAVAGVDYVLHQAALGSVPRSIEDPIASNLANVDGFLQMLVAARDAGVKRFVYASSSAVYGDSPELPKVEARIGNPLSPYAVTKWVNEIYARNFGLNYGLETVGLRYFNVFGPRQDPNGAYAAVIPKWLDLLRQGKPCVCFGDGETSRDFCYIDNVVQANILSALQPGISAEAFNIALGNRTNLKELYQLLAQAVAARKGSDKVASLEHRDFRSGDIMHSLADTSKAEKLLGYVPEVPIEVGVAKTVDWFLASAR